MYESFPHTADLGMRVQADTKGELFAEAARGLFNLIISDTRTVNAWMKETIRIEAEDDDYLFFDWLNELVYAFHVHKMLFVDFDIRITDDGLEAICYGEPFDPQRHEIDHDIKAVTYHGLIIEEQQTGWHGEVILDV